MLFGSDKQTDLTEKVYPEGQCVIVGENALNLG